MTDDMEMHPMPMPMPMPDSTLIQVDVAGVPAPNMAPLTKSQIRAARIQFASVCFCQFLAGWNDSSSGPMLPRIQQVYDVSFAIDVYQSVA